MSMANETKNNRRERFLKIYANLPIKAREEIICVLDEKGPITWNVAYLEIKNNTELGQKILRKLEELKII